MYKITFDIRRQMSFIDLPQFDALLAYCFVADILGYVPQKLSYSQSELIDFSKIPIEQHKAGFFLASQMFFEVEKHTESVGSWKKRWDNTNDDLVDFGKKNRQVDVSRGEFKSYDVPLTLHYVEQVWFYFQSQNVDEVKRLIESHLVGIGKKTAQGYGIHRGFEITKTNIATHT